VSQNAFPSSAIVNVTSARALARVSAGTGAVEEVGKDAFWQYLLDSLPTSEPVAIGLPWLNSGVLTVSTGIAPTIDTQPQATAAAPGSTATFTVAATNATSYQWQLDSGSGFANISGATSTSYETPELTELNNGDEYRVVVTGPGGSTTSNAVVLTVQLIGDRYISPTGDDDADGLTRGTAWATLGKLNTDMATLDGGAERTYVVMAGTYNDQRFNYGANKTATIVIDCEEGVIVDCEGAATKLDGIQVENSPNAFLTFNLRGAEFIGTTASSANGISTTNDVRFTVNGAAADGTLAHFHGYDDGASFHGTSGLADRIQINDCKFSDCSKSAWLHIQSAVGTHRRCVFIGKAGAASGVGDNQATLTSELQVFEDCEFIPASSGQTLGIRRSIMSGCKLGTASLSVNIGNQPGLMELTDCFLNATGDGPGTSSFLRCFGYLDFRIRGTASQEPVFQKCVFEGRTTSISLQNGSFFVSDGNWLGGSHLYEDCVIYDYGTAFNATNSNQIAHINANWSVDHCCMFENTNNFAAGITLGTNLVLADPLLGSRATTNQADWAVGVGSPCIGAGSDGGNIGFTLADIS
jgi:hypothetical protein